MYQLFTHKNSRKNSRKTSKKEHGLIFRKKGVKKNIINKKRKWVLRWVFTFFCKSYFSCVILSHGRRGFHLPIFLQSSFNHFILYFFLSSLTRHLLFLLIIIIINFIIFITIHINEKRIPIQKCCCGGDFCCLNSATTTTIKKLALRKWN